MGMTDEEANLHDTLSELKRHLRSDETGKIVLIGDVMMDCYIHGYANNLNSRAPVPVLRETSRKKTWVLQHTLLEACVPWVLRVICLVSLAMTRWAWHH